MPLKPIGGEIKSQTLNDNFSYLESKPIEEFNLQSNSIPASKLKTSSNSDRLKLENLSDEVLQAMAGNTPVNATPGPKGVTEEKVADGAISARVIGDNQVISDKVENKAIDENKVSFPALYVKKNKNLIDLTKVKKGVYIGVGGGGENPHASYAATEFIRIKPNTTYTHHRPDQMAFYDINKKYISGLGTTSDRTRTFTSPPNAYYLRSTIFVSYLDEAQIEENFYATKYEPFVTPKPIEEVIQEERLTDLLYHVTNPFIKTKIKIFGDSITAGVGGTGYSKTGEFMFKDYNGVDQYANVETAICWANSLKHHLEDTYNRVVTVALNDPRIKVYPFDHSYQEYSAAPTNKQHVFLGKVPGAVMMEFPVYGDSFSLIIAKSTSYGIFDIYVDGSYHTSVDGYNSSFLQNIEIPVTGLGAGVQHTIQLRETGNKNAAATATAAYIQGLKIPKTVIVKNWGISGRASRSMDLDKEKWIESDDDILLCQMGTNDRAYAPWGFTKEHQKNVIEYARSNGKKFIMMSSIPSSMRDETEVSPRYFHMDDIQVKLQELAHEMKVPFISNYQWFMDYTLFTGRTIDELLKDGLHPNDDGYEVIYRNVVQKLGFGYKRPGATW